MQNHAQLLADPLAIRMTDSRVRRFRRNYAVRRWVPLRYAIDINPQKSLRPHLPFHVTDFRPFRARPPRGGRANPLQIHVETPRPWPVSSAPQPASTKKWACAHSSVRPLQSEFRVYSRATAKARHRLRRVIVAGSLKGFATFKLYDPRYNRRSWNFRESRTLSICWDQRPLLRRPPLRQRKCERPSRYPAASNPDSTSPGAASIRDSGAALPPSLAHRRQRIFGRPAPFAIVGWNAGFPNEPSSARRYGMALSWRCRFRC